MTKKSSGAVRVRVRQVVAVRRELSELEAAIAAATRETVCFQGVTWRVTALRGAVRAVKRDLLLLESRLAATVAA